MTSDEWFAFWTPEERDILEAVARSHGWPWVQRHVLLILDQARAIGDLPDELPN